MPGSSVPSLAPGDHPPESATYPLAALVGQEQMRRALVLVGIEPALGGVLLRGEKGTAKSTAARALARLLPPIEVVSGCPVGCDPRGPLCPDCARRQPPLAREVVPTPFVELPLGASEDRVAGSLDLERAIRGGRVEFSPGLLARAHRGVLYIDEVNLLPVHIAALVLDAAAGGMNQVEREGVSYRHPARFSLVASCNPEEGPLGPQLLDRFGLCVEVRGESDPGRRQEILRRRLTYEADPVAFCRAWAGAEAEICRRLARARRSLARVGVDRRVRLLAAELAARAGSKGQRGELCCLLAARALAAWRGQSAVTPELVQEVAGLALDHRRTAHAREEQPVPVLRRGRRHPGAEPGPSSSRKPAAAELVQARGGRAGGGERTLYLLPPAPVRPVLTRLPAREGTCRRQAGRRSARETAGERGRYLRASAQRLGRPLALDATLRAAAPHQRQRRRAGGPALVVRPPDIREKVRAARRGRLLVFCVDASGSMNAAARMAETKAAVMGLLTEAYQKRDRVGLVAFGGTGARVLLPPTSSVEVARRLLAHLPTGGKTPLAAGLVALARVLERELTRDPRLTPLAVILTDGRPNVPLAAEKLGQRAGNKGGGWGDGWGDGGYADREVLNLAQRLAQMNGPRFVVVDTDVGHHHEINLCRPLADYLGAPCIPLRRVTAGQVLEVVKDHW